MTSQTKNIVHLENKLKAIQTNFVNNVSHELRTPLALVYGYAQLLSSQELGDLNPAQQKAAYTVVSRAKELQTTIERLLLLTEVSSQKQNLITQLFPASDLITQIIESQHAAAEKAGVVLSAGLAPGLPMVSGVFDHLEQAMICLVENAIKFSQPGDTVSVSAHVEDGQLCITVADTGCGIAPEQLPQILNRQFYQVDGSTTRRHGGLGLGLTLTKAVVNSHQGNLLIDSVEQQGTRVTLKLPIPSEAVTSDAQSGQTIKLQEASTKRILIVDDEAHITMMFKAGLKQMSDCEILTTNSATEALTYFEQYQIDLLITDYKMPDIDGISLATRVKERYPHTGVILITAYGNEQVIQQARQRFVERVLDKPVKLKVLRSAATELLQSETE